MPRKINIDKKIINIFNKFNINYYNSKKYNINEMPYFSGINMTYKNYIIKFDERFKNFDISQTIKEGLNNLNDVEGIENINNEIFIIEKQKNNEYVFIFNNNPFNLYYIYFKQYYNEIITLLNYICNFNNYKYKLNDNEKNINYLDNQYKILLKENYILKNFEIYNYNLLCDAYNDYYEMNDYKGYNENIIWFKNNKISFLNSSVYENFNNILKNLIYEFEEKNKLKNELEIKNKEILN